MSLTNELQKINEELKELKVTSFAGFNAKYPALFKKIKEVTSFLPINAKIQQRYWHIRNVTNQIPMCKFCKIKQCTWNSGTHKDKNNLYVVVTEYSETCNMSCFNKLHKDSRREQYTKTCLEKYGVKNTGCLTSSQQKRKQTTFDRYGVYYGGQTSEQKLKRQNTNLEKYGAANVMHSKIIKHDHQQKVREGHNITLNENEVVKQYVDNRLTALELAVTYNVNRSTIDRIIKKHNVKQFNKGKLSLDTLNILTDPKKLLTLQEEHKLSITDIATKLHIDPTTLYKRFQQNNIPTVSYFCKSAQEIALTEYIATILPNIQIIKNTKAIINPFELDIYIPSLNIAIEYCGLYWHSTAQDRITKNYHLNKLKLCKEKGIRLLTIFEDEWINKQDIVKLKLAYILNVNTNKIFARKTKCNIVSTHIKHQFFNTYHIQGDGPGSINIGLYHQHQLIACMTFIEQKNNNYILNRYATSINVVGGFTKLLSYFKCNFKWNKITSFADRRWSDGNLYQKTGWTLDKIIPPDYMYIDRKTNTRIHKFNFRHKNLPNILPNYDNSLSETENTKNNKWFRIYHCGLLRFVLKNNTNN